MGKRQQATSPAPLPVLNRHSTGPGRGSYVHIHTPGVRNTSSARTSGAILSKDSRRSGRGSEPPLQAPSPSRPPRGVRKGGSGGNLHKKSVLMLRRVLQLPKCNITFILENALDFSIDNSSVRNRLGSASYTPDSRALRGILLPEVSMNDKSISISVAIAPTSILLYTSVGPEIRSR